MPNQRLNKLDHLIKYISLKIADPTNSIVSKNQLEDVLKYIKVAFHTNSYTLDSKIDRWCYPAPYCPLCGGDMKARVNKETHSSFMGCCNYPQCCGAKTKRVNRKSMYRNSFW